MLRQIRFSRCLFTWSQCAYADAHAPQKLCTAIPIFEILSEMREAPQSNELSQYGRAFVQHVSTLTTVPRNRPSEALPSIEQQRDASFRWQSTVARHLHSSEANASGDLIAQPASPIVKEELDSSGHHQDLAGQEQAQLAVATDEGQGYSSPDQSGYMEDSEEASVSGSGPEPASPEEIDVNYRQVDFPTLPCTPLYLLLPVQIAFPACISRLWLWMEFGLHNYASA